MNQTGIAFEDETDGSDDYLCTEISGGYVELSFESDALNQSPVIRLGYDQTLNLIRHLGTIVKLLDCPPQRMSNRERTLNILETMSKTI